MLEKEQFQQYQQTFVLSHILTLFAKVDKILQRPFCHILLIQNYDCSQIRFCDFVYKEFSLWNCFLLLDYRRQNSTADIQQQQ